MRTRQPLSADPGNRVLVLEAGRNDSLWDVFVHMPAALPFPIGSRFYDWKYESEPEPHMHGRRIYHARGKVLGGSSSINGMIFQRGNPMDYERWGADPGMGDWDFAHCLPYFNRMENCLAAAPDDPYRGHDGPLALERGPATNPLFEAFFDAAEQAGYPRTDDVNGYRQEGFAKFDRNIRNGRRLSAARAYLHPVMKRPNLDVITRAFVERVVFEGKRAVGVEYRRFGSAKRVNAGQVVLCGGAINTPQLLQLSGVGNAADLQALGIDVVHDLPGVGENLQDHLEVYIQYACKQPVTMQKYLKWRYRPWIGANWLFLRRGPGATNHFEGGGLRPQQRRRRLPEPDVPLPADRGALRRVVAGGRRRLSGARRPDVLRRPRHPEDRQPRPDRCIRRCGSTTCPPIRTAASGWSPSALRAASSISLRWHRSTAARSPPARVWKPTSRSSTGSRATPKPRCTRPAPPRWAPTQMSVTDPQTMGVHGVEGLKVVDASVMPYVTNGNIYAPVMMVAEKAADLILGNEPLAPATVPFYRHQPKQQANDQEPVPRS